MGGLTTTDGAAMSRKRKAESNKLLATLSSKKVKVAQAGDERDHPKTSWTTLPNELRIMIFKEVLNAVLDEQIAVVGSWTLENTSRWDVEKADAYHRTGKPTRACNKAMKSMCAMQPGNNAVLIKAVRDSKTELEAKMEQSANDRTFEDRLWSSFEELVDAWRNSNMKEMYQRVLNAMARKLEDLEEAAII